MLQTMLQGIPDHRRGQGRMYKLEQVLLITVLAILSGAKSYRNIHSFIKIHYETLNSLLQLNRKKIPAYSSIRFIIQGIDAKELEKVFRKHAYKLAQVEKRGRRYIATDGKTLKGSYDNFNDKKAIQVLSGLLIGAEIILFHELIEEKSNEIPAVQKMLKELDLWDVVYTLDAMRCQKKRSK